jgi:hypothetical protein
MSITLPTDTPACGRCRRPSAPGKKRCEACLAYARACHARRLAAGLCGEYGCPNPAPDPPAIRCRACNDRRNPVTRACKREARRKAAVPA